jgi:hypothetical protein
MKNTKLQIAALFAMGALAAGSALAVDVKVKLSGDNEVPAVKTQATGEGTITIGDDGSVSGSISTKGIDGTMGHIHLAAAGKNGPVIVKLTKDGDTYKVPADAHLDAAQIAAFKAGELYVNVHSAANKAGEIRAQLK